MPTLDEVRQKHPQYHDMSDDVLADKLHAKFYADMPRAEFDQKIGYTKNYSFSEIPGAAIEHAPESAVRLAKDIVHPFIHPIETLQSVKALGTGILQKLNVVGGHEQEKYADALGKYFVDRYGSVQAVKNALATDPAGILADASMVFSGGETALARAPGLVGKVGEVAGSVGRAIDPVTAAGRSVKGAAKAGSEVIGGFGTHTGGRPIREAAAAGYEGGAGAKAFQENLRGQRDFGEVVNDARQAVAQIRQQRGREYRAEMAKVGADQTVLDFSKIDAALANVTGVKTYKGVSISPSTQQIRQDIGQAIQEWKMLPPADYHTAEGLDALKQKIGDIRDAAPYGTPERVVADQAYHAVRQTIVDQVPEYARVMKGYEEASTLIKEIERTLSLNPNASVDTTLRKLQSVLRNNVHTNFAQRERLAEFLANAGAPNLMQALAGQALSSWTPRGLGKMVGTEILAGGAGLLGAGAAGGAAGALAALPFMSPRLVGETAFYAGKAAGRVPARASARGAYLTGRMTNPLGNGAGSPLADQPEPVAEPGP